MNPIAIVYILIAITVWSSVKGFRDVAFRERYLFSTAGVLGRHEADRLFTAAGLHSGWWHLGVNMYCLWVFGAPIAMGEPHGAWLLAGLYVVSVLGGSLLSLYLQRNNLHYRALGASGGVSGVIFASIFLMPGGWMTLFIPLPVTLPAWLFAILYVMYSMYGIRSGVGNIGHDAHLGGALSGLGLIAMLRPMAIIQEWPLFVAIAGLMAAFIWLSRVVPPGYSIRESVEYMKSRWKNYRKQRNRVTAGQEEARMDELLDRISKEGIGNLSKREKEELSSLALRKKERDEAARRSPDRWRRQ